MPGTRPGMTEERLRSGNQQSTYNHGISDA
jgi:hypothetical protein